ncbi:MAG: hypothetical protein LC670_09735 [Flavobacteriales bacterium]|nr:hypothetical protein [Flavobacteriales bacterium]
MEISYRTKEESNREQEEAFLRLSPAERMMAFFELSRRIARFPVQHTDEARRKGNFVIERPSHEKAAKGEH